MAAQQGYDEMYVYLIKLQCRVAPITPGLGWDWNSRTTPKSGIQIKIFFFFKLLWFWRVRWPGT